MTAAALCCPAPRGFHRAASSRSVSAPWFPSIQELLPVSSGLEPRQEWNYQYRSAVSAVNPDKTIDPRSSRGSSRYRSGRGRRLDWATVMGAAVASMLVPVSIPACIVNE